LIKKIIAPKSPLAGFMAKSKKDGCWNMKKYKSGP
jgi:hypothetical protein